MKTSINILFLVLFIASQYARQFNYLECKFANVLKTAAVQCDCEAAVKQPANNKNLPLQKMHVHSSIDEFFTADKSHKISSPDHVIAINNFPVFISDKYPPGFLIKLRKPPRV